MHKCKKLVIKHLLELIGRSKLVLKANCYSKVCYILSVNSFIFVFIFI